MVKISFKTRCCYVVNVPKNIKKITKIKKFILDRINDGDLEDFIDKYLDYEIEDFEMEEIT